MQQFNLLICLIGRQMIISKRLKYLTFGWGSLHNLMPSLRCPKLTNILTITFTIRKFPLRPEKKLQGFGKIPWNLKFFFNVWQCCVTLPQIFLDACVRWLVWLKLLEFVEERWTVQVQTCDGEELLEVSSDIAVEEWRQTTLSAGVLSPG